MRQLLFLTLCITCLYSCMNGSNTASGHDFKYEKTSIGTLKEYWRANIEQPDDYSANTAFLRKNKDEVLKTLEVVEEVEVVKDVFLIFYRYSIGTNTVKKTSYMRKMDGLYYPFYAYYSSYDDDPFKNGKGEEAKALLKKADEWKKNDNIWWD